MVYVWACKSFYIHPLPLRDYINGLRVGVQVFLYTPFTPSGLHKWFTCGGARRGAAMSSHLTPPGQDYFGIRRGLLMLFYSKKYLTIALDLL